MTIVTDKNHIVYKFPACLEVFIHVRAGLKYQWMVGEKTAAADSVVPSCGERWTGFWQGSGLNLSMKGINIKQLGEGAPELLSNHLHVIYICNYFNIITLYSWWYKYSLNMTWELDKDQKTDGWTKIKKKN